jgi:hypothetical protein
VQVFHRDFGSNCTSIFHTKETGLLKAEISANKGK